MSYVNNVLLSFDTLEAENERMAEVNAALHQLWPHRPQGFGNLNGPDSDLWYGGYKYMEACLWGAALNYVPLARVKQACRAARWQSPQLVQVIWRGQDDDTWTIHGIEAPVASEEEQADQIIDGSDDG